MQHSGAVEAFRVSPVERPLRATEGQAASRGGVEPDLLVRPAPGAPGDPVLDAAVARLLGPSP